MKEKRAKKRARDSDEESQPSAGQPQQETLADFNRVELILDISRDSQPNRDAATGRDLRQLLEWCLPTANPIVEAPKVFYVRNKSAVRHVLYVYVQGWSYQDLCGTVLEEELLSDSETVATRLEHHKHLLKVKLAQLLLHPLRSSQCWARVPSAFGGGAADMLNPHHPLAPQKHCAVHCAPLVVPSSEYLLEKEIFWRTSFSREAEATTPKEKGSEGVANRYRIAMAIHHGTPAQSPVEPPKHSPTSETREEEGEVEPSCCWDNRELLLQLALRWPQDSDRLKELGFTVAAPLPSPLKSVSDDTTANSPYHWMTFPPPRVGNKREDPSVVALDCEMVLVEGNHSALARATLLDARTGDVLMDRLVKPTQPILDYVTRYSGIDEELLKDVSYTLPQCQEELCRFIDSDTFLVGHSLENDLKACQFLPNCYLLDSAWLFPHPAGLPCKNSLRFLIHRYFNKKIQQGSHDSTEDAWCSAQLVRLKMLYGPDFAMPVRHSVLCRMAAATEYSEAESDLQLSRWWSSYHLFDSPEAMKELVPCGSKISGVGAVNTVPVRHDSDAVRKAVRALQQSSLECLTPRATLPSGESKESFHFFWVRLSENRRPFEKTPEAPGAENGLESDPELLRRQLQACEDAWRPDIETTNRHVLRLVEAAPDGTVVAVMTGAVGSANNPFAKNRGVLFTFVKDGTARPGLVLSPRLDSTPVSFTDQLLKEANDEASLRLPKPEQLPEPSACLAQ